MKRFSIIIAACAALLIGSLALAEVRFSKDFRGQPAIHRSQIQVTAESITLAAQGAGTNGYGSITLHTLPEGQIAFLGAVCDLTATFPTAQVANASGIDVSIGTVATSDDDVGDTGEATIIASIGVDPFTNTTSAIQGSMSANSIQDGTSTAKSMILNMLIDDADFADGATGTVSGVIWLLWSEVGDY